MSNQSWVRSGSLIALLSSIAGAAAAVPLTYNVVQAESNILVQAKVNNTIDVSPDFTETLGGTGQFPVTEQMTGFSQTQPSGLSHLTADVGLPGSFANGANGIDFSSLVIHTFNAPGVIGGSTNVPVPLGITGSPVTYVTVTASLATLQITLNAPFSSSLTPSVNPDEWLWAGVADVTISGTFSPQLLLPAQLPVAPTPTPFSQNVLLPLAGTFSGDPTSTRVTIGIDEDAIGNQNLSLPPIEETVDLLDLGLVTLTYKFNDLLLADLTAGIVYRNATPIPEPGTAFLVALGLGLVGFARRRLH
jgi:hypothetical protein